MFNEYEKETIGEFIRSLGSLVNEGESGDYQLSIILDSMEDMEFSAYLVGCFIGRFGYSRTSEVHKALNKFYLKDLLDRL